MAFLDNTGLGTLWGRIKTKFAVGFGTVSANQTSVTIKLKNGYGNDLDTDTSANPPLYYNSVTLDLADSTNSKAGLMSPTEKSKLAGIASGAEVNVQSDWNQATTTADDYIKNKPTKLSDFTNDSGFITSASVPSATSTPPKMDGTATVGTETTYARGDHIHPTDTSRASSTHTHGKIANDGTISTASGDTVSIASGDRLLIVDSSNSNKITAVDTTRMFDGSTTTKALTQNGTFETFVQDNNYVHTDFNYTLSDSLKVSYVDTNGSVSTYVSNAIASAMTGSAKYKGTVDSSHPLPTTGYKQGDYYVVGTAGTYAGQTCEVGDMIFCNKNYASGTASNSDWDIVQSNITAMTQAEIEAICV